MLDPAISYSSASYLQQQIQKGEIRSRQLLELFVERIETFNPSLNAVVTFDIERARLQADLCDKASSNRPLHGLPITVKDTYEVEGILTTAGSPKLANHISTTNAVAIQRLLDAGAIVFGKTNTPAFAADIQTNNPVFGVTNNPWDTSRTPGGSSGGSAVSTAMGFTAFEIGSDIGGSLRTPAHFCGVYTIKPSYGIIPTTGMLSSTHPNFAARDIGCAGPMARSAKDLSLLLDVLAGPTGSKAVAWQLHLPKPKKTLQQYRVAAWLDDDFCPVDHAIVEQLEKTVEKLEQAGVCVDRKARPDFNLEHANDIYTQLLAAASVTDVPDYAIEKRRQDIENYSAEKKQKMAYQSVKYSLASVHQFAKAREAQQRICDKWRQFFNDYDILLCPVNPSLAFPHIDTKENFFQSVSINGELRDYSEMLVWIGALAGVAYLPAVSAPAELSPNGLPIGAQIIAPYLHDHYAIDFADKLAAIHGGYQAPPIALE